ncbi:hypothetical protein NB640_00060 [Oxalobacter vibrioformis]|uniref:DUF883 domain-containing protein n=1 Tax=Oxalobacter vibrioformis TaxID=933080 RepID=A0A9E9P2P5_9BURK|nr:hypothetical protein [Oxalobacter vibrioformis]WAW10109.1 hypothetical protein NB640_00060 [Oxalobacter vibrioformis]
MTSTTEENTARIIRIESLDNSASEKGPCGLGAFPTPCRILCGKEDGDEAACFVHSLALTERITTCAEKTASLVRKHPLKSLAIAGVAGLFIGALLFRKN